MWGTLVSQHELYWGQLLWTKLENKYIFLTFWVIIPHSQWESVEVCSLVKSASLKNIVPLGAFAEALVLMSIIYMSA